jgi:cobalt-zinc-cadmium efflux system membrane fusion protein
MNVSKFQLNVVKPILKVFQESKIKRKYFLASAFLSLTVAVGLSSCKKESDKAAVEPPLATAAAAFNFVDLTEKQAAGLKPKTVEQTNFVSQLAAFGSVDFNENSAVQVFTPYQGKIIQSFSDVGDFVSKGQPLYTVDSSDLAQAESTLLSAKGVFDQSNATLNRAKDLYQMRSISLKELEQNTADQNAAEASLKAAREGVRIFGKTTADIQKIESERKLDTVLVVTSPISGQVVSRNAQPGLLVQPGNANAPYVVADVVNKWLIINASEEDSTKLHVGQELEVKVPVLPEESFKARIKVVGSIVDPSTRTVLVRADISDPKRVLRSGMYATYIVKGDKVVKGIGVPEDAIVREGDGTMSVWVTEDGRHWVSRTVTLGLKTNGLVQVTNGLEEGEKIATTGAIFLSSMLFKNK